MTTEAEPQLQLKYSDLQIVAAEHQGWGVDSSGWDADITAAIDRLVQDGYRQFIVPPPLPGQKAGHRWSFLRPVRKLQIAPGRWEYLLPPDVGSLEGEVTHAAVTGQGEAYFRVPIKCEGQIREAQATTDRSGRPLFVGIRPAEQLPGFGQRWELVMYPTPDTTYTLMYPCKLMPLPLSATNPYHLGGPWHSETVRASILAESERTIEETGGPQLARFFERLAASITHDSQSFQGRRLGPNLDRSDRARFDDDERWHWDTHSVTYNGVEYD